MEEVGFEDRYGGDSFVNEGVSCEMGNVEEYVEVVGQVADEGRPEGEGTIG